MSKAWAAWLHYGLGLSVAKCTRLADGRGFDVSAGALCQAAQRSGIDLVLVHAEIVRWVNDAPVVVADGRGFDPSQVGLVGQRPLRRDARYR